MRQTHLSVVCLVGELAYKLRKPVRFSFADFSTVERRRFFCEEEVRLNRRLCPEVYLRVVPLYATASGSWTFREEEGGTVVDWATLMRRLPEDLLMSARLEANAVSAAEVQTLAEMVAAFHAGAVMDEAVREAGSPENQRAAILANFEGTESYRGEVFDAELHEGLEGWVRADLEGFLMPRLRDREGRGLVVDGHGDLHARNIFLTDPPTIFDCIEFKPEFRCGDVAVENAFLIMDLIYRGHPELARCYLDAYIAERGDEEERELMPSLVSYRAMVRAKVAALASGDADIGEAEREEQREAARRYLQLAAGAAIGARRRWVLGCGLPGTGKSFLLERLARRTGWGLLSSDRIRKELAGVDPTEKLPLSWYGAEANDETYRVMRERAGEAPEAVVLLDANFRTAARREEAREAAKRAGAEVTVLWVEADEATVRERLRRRDEEEGSESDADWTVYESLREKFEAPEGEGEGVIRVDGGANAEVSVVEVLGWMVGSMERKRGADFSPQCPD